MSNKLELLQKLLHDREEAIVLHRGRAYCSCGADFTDFSDIENHLVQSHDKLSSESSRKSLQDVLKDVVNKLSEPPSLLVSSEQQLDIDLPPRTFAVCLDEDLIDGGSIRSINCHECAASCYSFKTLKDHYMRQHPGSWACAETCRNFERISFARPSKSQRAPQGLSFRYFCPLPGCKYHVANAKFSFPSYSLLKQHYSKMHASRDRKCPKCGTGFATDVYLRRHKKLNCGRSFPCQSCTAVFSALENLQTHCRRKGHQRPLEPKKLPEEPAKKTIKKDNNDKYVKIAPRPSLTMTAALALSELSTKEPLSKMSDKQLASTQTSPRGTTVVEDPCATAEMPLEQPPPHKIPKLGEIEQFSTETQTDDLEQLLKSSTATQSQNEDAFTIEAQTQFDLDDILCSNYTQTVLFDTSLDQSSAVGVNSAETQTMLMSYDLVNMETQTMSMLFDSEEVNS